MKRNALLAAAATIMVVTSAAAATADAVRVALVGGRPALTAGRAWTARLVVHPASFRGVLRVTATGPKRIDVLASGRHGSYRARFVFPIAGRWLLTARAGTSISRLGIVDVRRAASVPLTFVWPTSVNVEPDGSLLLVENGLRRLLRIDPSTGRVATIATLTKPYAARRAPSGSIYVSDGPSLQRIDGAGKPVTVAAAGSDIGPIAIASNGDVYFTTSTAIWKLANGAGTPIRIAETADLSTPHGLAIAPDGTVLVADTGSDRILRIDPNSGAIMTFAELAVPRGMDIAADGTIYVVGGGVNRVVHLSASGTPLGLVGPTFNDPYDVATAPDGAVYVVESLMAGDVRRVASDGTVTTVSRH